MKPRIILSWTIFACLVLSFVTASLAEAANTTEQILTQIDDILKANPMKVTDKIQVINVVQDDTVTINIVRRVEGAEIKPHVHKTHDEMIYVIKGSGQMLVNGKWIDVKAGTFHFNPMNKVHATRNTGKGDLVVLVIFTPALKEPDRYFLDEK